MLESNELDLAFPMGFSSVRSEMLTPSKTVLVLEDRWMYNLPPPDTSDRSLPIAVKAGSLQQSWLGSKGYTNVSAVPSYSSLVLMLKAKNVKAILYSDTDGNPADAIFPLEGMRVSLQSTREVGFYFNPKTHPDVIQAFNSVIPLCINAK